MRRFVAVCTVPTEKAEPYAKQVAKHWNHTLPVRETEQGVEIIFPRDARGASWPDAATVTLQATATGLQCTIDASAPGQRDGLKGAVASHLDRFAFREAPLAFEWKDH